MRFERTLASRYAKPRQKNFETACKFALKLEEAYTQSNMQEMNNIVHPKKRKF